MVRRKMLEGDKKIKTSVSIDNDVFVSLNDYISKNGGKRSSIIEKLLKKYINRK